MIEQKSTFVTVIFGLNFEVMLKKSDNMTSNVISMRSLYFWVWVIQEPELRLWCWVGCNCAVSFNLDL